MYILMNSFLRIWSESEREDKWKAKSSTGTCTQWHKGWFSYHVGESNQLCQISTITNKGNSNSMINQYYIWSMMTNIANTHRLNIWLIAGFGKWRVLARKWRKKTRNWWNEGGHWCHFILTQRTEIYININYPSRGKIQTLIQIEAI